MGEDELRAVEREFAQLGYEIHVEESKGGWWLAAYRPRGGQEWGTANTYDGRSPVDAARAALAGLRDELSQRESS